VFSRPSTGIELPYSESSAIAIRNIDDIIKDAKTGFYLVKEQRKELKKSFELGSPKPIFKKLIDEIKQEFDVQKPRGLVSKLNSSALIIKPPSTETPETDQQSNNKSTATKVRPRSAPSHRSLPRQVNATTPSTLLSPLEDVAEFYTNTNAITINTVTNTSYSSNQSSSLKSKLWANIESAKSISDEMSNHSNFDTAGTFSSNFPTKG